MGTTPSKLNVLERMIKNFDRLTMKPGKLQTFCELEWPSFRTRRVLEATLDSRQPQRYEMLWLTSQGTQTSSLVLTPGYRWCKPLLYGLGYVPVGTPRNPPPEGGGPKRETNSSTVSPVGRWSISNCHTACGPSSTLPRNPWCTLAVVSGGRASLHLWGFNDCESSTTLPLMPNANGKGEITSPIHYNLCVF